MATKKTTKKKYKYEYKDLEQASEQINLLQQKLSDLEKEVDADESDNLDLVYKNMGLIQQTSQELTKGQNLYDRIDNYLQNKAFDRNGQLKKKWSG